MNFYFFRDQAWLYGAIQCHFWIMFVLCLGWFNCFSNFQRFVQDDVELSCSADNLSQGLRARVALAPIFLLKAISHSNMLFYIPVIQCLISLVG